MRLTVIGCSGSFPGPASPANYPPPTSPAGYPPPSAAGGYTPPTSPAGYPTGEYNPGYGQQAQGGQDQEERHRVGARLRQRDGRGGEPRWERGHGVSSRVSGVTVAPVLTR